MSKVTFQMDQLDPVLLAELDQFIANQTDPEGNIIQILHKAQTLFGYLPKELQLYVARQVNVPTAKINGIVSFYSLFNEEPSGKYGISVCMGTACFVKGSEAILKAFKEQLGFTEEIRVTSDGLFSLRDVRCIGACGLAPVVMVNDKIFGHVKAEDVAGIIATFRQAEAEVDHEN